MCYRELLFKRSVECDHLTKTGQNIIDCQSSRCYLSNAHPSNCGSHHRPCSCRRYYGQPIRRVTAEVSPHLCAILSPGAHFWTVRSQANVHCAWRKAYDTDILFSH
ncbi:uncharacterized protein EV420DRAFT_285951 [Desarmillaria tabescens]|uniref:Uncharacterized protein n=1 Tax=Armillaria tabescens TaxID=1929756 RepID=A0AA39N6Z7_ARMTA|nr:uncharacterized protein EV420DRAFT_285951 [Desarmillaria tabescens]KAK0459723.1 hypothetical protein EV420DRAFT_285951 [Desarmillaria tabescens]